MAIAQCQEIRSEAANYKEQKVSFASGALLGPYGLALAAAGKEHQEKKRRQLAVRCICDAQVSHCRRASGRSDGQAEKQLWKSTRLRCRVSFLQCVSPPLPGYLGFLDRRA